MISGGYKTPIVVIVICEGQTEEQFIKKVVAPALISLDIILKPEMLQTSPGKVGGGINFERIKKHTGNTLKRSPNVILTTFLDLYGLSPSFPDFEETKKKPIDARVTHLCKAFQDSIIQHTGCRPERFIPHIQPYEYEGLLFSDPEAFVRIEHEWGKKLEVLKKIKDAYSTPEHINGTQETSPSHRLKQILVPRYQKTRHGILVAKEITLAIMENECKHFHNWVNRLRALKQINQ